MSLLSKLKPLTFPKLGLVRLPKVTITKEQREKLGLKETASNTAFLKALVWNGYKEKEKKGLFKGFDEKTVKERLATEFAVFEKTGTIDYLLLVWDILRWCDEQKIPKGLGRGSVTGSLALYCAGLTDVNALKHNLNFTRFISEARAKPKIIDGVMYVAGKSLMDIDNDISFAGRSAVLKYIEETHKGRTCMISNRLTLTGKMALKDVLKTYLGYNEDQAKKLTDQFDSVFGKVESLEDAFKKHEPLKRWAESNPLNQKALDIARGLEGLNVTKGQHASGVFISFDELDGNIPIELSNKKQLVTSFDMEIAAEVATKLDILGLRTVDVVNETCRLAGINRDDIDVNHQSIYDYYKSNDLYYGLFQIEDGLTKSVVKRVGPRHIEDLFACLAISRPGAFKYIDDFVKYVKNGEFKSIYPPIDEILKNTGNIILYQEQINAVCQNVYGMSAVDADEVRRAIGKKLKDDMAKWEPELYRHGKEKGIPEKVTKIFWDTCNASADYMFSVNHSAAYSYLTAITTYLKANHAKEFALALLKMSREESKPQEVISAVITEGRQLGVNILPPSLTKSEIDFTFEGQDIRFGLSHIRGISDITMKKLLSFRRNFPNKFAAFEAAEAAGINIAVLSGLIYCGCLDMPGFTRARLALEAQSYNILTPREKPIVHKLAKEYKEDLLNIILAMKTLKNDKGKPLITASRFETFKKKYDPFKKIYLENSKNEDLCSYIMERHFLGFSYSKTLRAIFENQGVQGLIDIVKVSTEVSEADVRFASLVGEVEKKTSRNSNKPYLKLHLSDDTASIGGFMFGAQELDICFKAYGRLPEEGDIVIINGRKKGDDSVYINNISIQKNPIILKKSELPSLNTNDKSNLETD